MIKSFRRTAFIGILLALAITAPTSSWAGAVSLDPAARMAKYGLVNRDLEDIDRALSSAYKSLSEIWSRIFAENHLKYRNPGLKRYVAEGTARCGPEFLSVGNAYYCQPDDVIWYDPIFLARVKQVVRIRSKQPGDSVPFLVIAHEWGHAVAGRLGFGKQSVGTNVEVDADCYAGAATWELMNARRLPATALREAEELFDLLGAPESKATGAFADLVSRSHGISSERRIAFRIGVDTGTKSCQGEKRYYEMLRKAQQPIK